MSGSVMGRAVIDLLEGFEKKMYPLPSHSFSKIRWVSIWCQRRDLNPRPKAYESLLAWFQIVSRRAHPERVE